MYVISNTSRPLTQVSIKKLEYCSVQPLALPLSFGGHLEKDISASVRFVCVLLNQRPRTPVQETFCSVLSPPGANVPPLATLTLLVPRVTNINFLLTTSADHQEYWLWELLNWLPNGECFDFRPSSLNCSEKKCLEINLENLYVYLGA